MTLNISIQLNKIDSYLTKLINRMKKNPSNEVFKDSYKYWTVERHNLLCYALEPMVDDGEIY